MPRSKKRTLNSNGRTLTLPPFFIHLELESGGR
jgi:hypothetical protein